MFINYLNILGNILSITFITKYIKKALQQLQLAGFKAQLPKSNISNKQITNFMVISHDGINKAYAPIEEFSTVSLGLEKGNNLLTIISKVEHENANTYLSHFQQVWQDNDILQDVTESVKNMIREACALIVDTYRAELTDKNPDTSALLLEVQNGLNIKELDSLNKDKIDPDEILAELQEKALAFTNF